MRLLCALLLLCVAVGCQAMRVNLTDGLSGRQLLQTATCTPSSLKCCAGVGGCCGSYCSAMKSTPFENFGIATPSANLCPNHDFGYTSCSSGSSLGSSRCGPSEKDCCDCNGEPITITATPQYPKINVRCGGTDNVAIKYTATSTNTAADPDTKCNYPITAAGPFVYSVQSPKFVITPVKLKPLYGPICSYDDVVCDPGAGAAVDRCPFVTDNWDCGRPSLSYKCLVISGNGQQTGKILECSECDLTCGSQFQIVYTAKAKCNGGDCTDPSCWVTLNSQTFTIGSNSDGKFDTFDWPEACPPVGGLESNSRCRFPIALGPSQYTDFQPILPWSKDMCAVQARATVSFCRRTYTQWYKWGSSPLCKPKQA